MKYFKLMISCFIILLSFALITPNEEEISEFDQAQIKITVQKFMSELPLYCNLDSENKLQERFGTILGLFEKQNSAYVFDLFSYSKSELEYGLACEVQTYLFDIKEAYGNNIDVEFPEAIKLNKVFDKTSGKDLIEVKLPKIVRYNGERKEFTSALYFKENSNKIYRINISGEEERLQPANLAEKEFTKGNYQNAQKYYQQAVDEAPFETDLARRLMVCTSINEGKKLFDSGDFETAVDFFERVLLVEKLPYAQSKFDYCKSEIKRREEQKIAAEKEKQLRLEALIAEANNKFNNNDFVAAKSIYEEVLSEKGTDEFLLDRIDIATTIIQANTLYKKQSYKEALDKYKSISNAEGIPYVKDRIFECENNAKYQSIISQADELYALYKYKMALSSYEYALGYRPNDPYVQGRIKGLSESLLRQEKEDTQDDINEALGMIYGKSPKGKDYAVAFRILYRHENTGLLDGRAWKIMTFTLLANYGGIQKKMKFSNKTKNNLLKKYFAEAYMAGAIKRGDVRFQLYNKKQINEMFQELRKMGWR